MKAFFYMLYRNGRKRWLKGGIWLKNHPTFKGLGAGPSPEMKAADPNLDLDMWVSEFSTNKKGKTPCGWSPQSLEMYKKMVVQMAEIFAKDGPKIRKLEADFLPLLKAEVGVTDLSTGKKRKVDPVEAVVDLIDFSDDEDYFAVGESAML